MRNPAAPPLMSQPPPPLPGAPPSGPPPRGSPGIPPPNFSQPPPNYNQPPPGYNHGNQPQPPRYPPREPPRDPSRQVYDYNGKKLNHLSATSKYDSDGNRSRDSDRYDRDSKRSRVVDYDDRRRERSPRREKRYFLCVERYLRFQSFSTCIQKEKWI